MSFWLPLEKEDETDRGKKFSPGSGEQPPAKFTYGWNVSNTGPKSESVGLQFMIA
jgi:hypothetical protein